MWNKTLFSLHTGCYSEFLIYIESAELPQPPAVVSTVVITPRSSSQAHVVYERKASVWLGVCAGPCWLSPRAGHWWGHGHENPGSQSRVQAGRAGSDGHDTLEEECLETVSVAPLSSTGCEALPTPTSQDPFLIPACVQACSVMPNSLQPRQSPLSLGFPKQEYWTGLPCPLPKTPWRSQ